MQSLNCTELLMNINKNQIRAKELLCFRLALELLCWLENWVLAHQLLSCAFLGWEHHCGLLGSAGCTAVADFR